MQAHSHVWFPGDEFVEEEPFDPHTGEVYDRRDVVLARMLCVPVAQLMRERREDDVTW